MIPVLFLVLILLLPKMKSLVVTLAAVVVFHITGRHSLYQDGLGSGCAVATTNWCTGCAADCGAENRAILPTHAVTHCCTGRTADRTAYHRTAIHGIGIHTDRKK